MLSSMVASMSHSEAKTEVCSLVGCCCMIEEKESSSAVKSVTGENGGKWLWNVVRRLTIDWLSHRIVHWGEHWDLPELF